MNKGRSEYHRANLWWFIFTTSILLYDIFVIGTGFILALRTAKTWPVIPLQLGIQKLQALSDDSPIFNVFVKIFSTSNVIFCRK